METRTQSCTTYSLDCERDPPICIAFTKTTIFAINVITTDMQLWATVNHVMKRTEHRDCCTAMVDSASLNSYFHSIVNGPSASYDFPLGPGPKLAVISFSAVSEESVAGLLKSLKPGKECGPDGLLPGLLRSLADPRAQSITMAFNASLCTSSTFPCKFKLAHITPILKSKQGDPHSPSNDRPASLTSVLSKLLQKVVRRQISTQLTDSKVLHDHQFGFRSCRSTAQLLTLAIKFINDWISSRDSGNTTAIAFVDLSKTFDRVLHQQQLLHSPHHLGITGSAWESLALQVQQCSSTTVCEI
eukprot:scpid73920/ scgid16487/ Probable RNA-directed DNA polymerase from transposon BS; Reverse transcriptase